MLLTITDAGRVAEAGALQTGAMSPVSAVLIGDGAPHADPQTAAALVHQVTSVPVSAVERISAQAVRFYATVPQGETIVIREIGLQLADGTLYGYLPYATLVGAPLHKDAHFAFSFSLAVSREALPPIEVDYNPLDTGALAADIADQTLSAITDYGNRLTGAEAAFALEAQGRTAAIAAEAQARDVAIAASVAAAEERALKASLTPHVEIALTYGEDELISEVVETLPTATRTLLYTYTEDGRIASVSGELDGVVRVETFAYDEDGRLIGMVAGPPEEEDPE